MVENLLEVLCLILDESTKTEPHPSKINSPVRNLKGYEEHVYMHVCMYKGNGHFMLELPPDRP